MYRAAPTPADISSDSNSTLFIIRRLLGAYAFIDLVKVIEVVDETVTVVSLLCEVSRDGEKIEPLPVYGVPFMRLLSGESSVIMNPKVGDVGIMAVCDRDISVSKKTKKVSAPPTARVHSKTDGVYLTGIALLNTKPSQFIRFNDSGIDIKSPGSVNINGLQVLSDGRLQLVNGVVVDTHVHGGVQSGGSTTKEPQ